MTALVFSTPRIEFECSGCGGKYEVSYRHANEIRRKGLSRICGDCRTPERRVRPVVTDELKWWWRRRFTEGEIVGMAEAIWGPVEDWPPPSNPQVVDFGFLAAGSSGNLPGIKDN